MAIFSLYHSGSNCNRSSGISHKKTPGRARSHPIVIATFQSCPNPYGQYSAVRSHYRVYTDKQLKNFIHYTCAQKRERSRFWIAIPIHSLTGIENFPNNKSPPWLLLDFDAKQQTQRGQFKMIKLSTLSQTTHQYQGVQNYYRASIPDGLGGAR